MVSALILAAGSGKRMGTLKQLLPWNDKTLIQHIVSVVLSCSEIQDVRVVLGAGAGRITPCLVGWGDSRLHLVKNENHEQGMLTSIKAGIISLPEKAECFFVVLGDQPFIDHEVFTRLLAAFNHGSGDIIRPAYKGRCGHPVLVSTNFVPEIMTLEGPGGLRSLIDRYPDKTVQIAWQNEGILIDLDYPNDYNYYHPRLKEEREC